MKIALMAMSGIRVCDTELLELGLTLPGFVERSKTIASLPSLGLLTLAGMTPRHHELSYIEVPDLTAVDPLPADFDLIAISSYSAQINEAYDLAAQYKSLGIPVVIGGPHVSVLPHEAIDHCDAVVIGEGECVWLDVLNDCENGKLKRIYGSLKGKYSLNNAPIPAFELLDISKYNRLTVQTSRGCPHRCEFCASSILLVDEYKQKPMHQVLAEIDKIIDIWKNPFIEFADDNTFVNKEYWKELLTQLKERKIKWFTETDLSVSEDEKLLELMRESGCAQVLIGFESPNQPALQGVDLRNDWKYNHFTKYKEAIQKIQSHGVTVNGCFVIGLDGHDETIFEQVFEFVKEAKLYEVQVTILTPFPGTPLYERLKDQNRLLEPEAWTKCTLFDLNFEPLNMTREALAGGFKTLVSKLYDDDFTRWRRDHFKKYLRNNPVTKGDRVS